MIKKVIITNYLGESIELELRRPELTGLYIESITGLGPGKANINTTDIATDDGAIFNSARSEERNIVMKIGFMISEGVTESIEQARHLTYKYFPKKKPIVFYILTDERELKCLGYVEENEPDIFSDKETTQISIICPDPMFYSAETNTTTFNGVDFNFEFPFENNTVGDVAVIIPGIARELQVIVDELPETGDPSLYYFLRHQDSTYLYDEYRYLANDWIFVATRMYYSPEIEMGSIENLKERSIWYDGDAETGILIQIHAIGSAEHIVIYNTGTRERMILDTDKLATLTGEGIVQGDEITISTVKGDKYIRLLRNGVQYNILNILDKNSDWFQLAKGDNIFTYTATYGASNLQFRILNNIAFEGI